MNSSTHAPFAFPEPINEPVLSYLPGSPERGSLATELAHQSQAGDPFEVPLVIGGRNIRSTSTVRAVLPHDHAHILAQVHTAGESETRLAVESALRAKHDWAAMPMHARASIFMKAAHLLSQPVWRNRLNAATMLNQSKTCHQAEIDSACELIDFLNFNVCFAQQIYEQIQPPVSPRGTWNRVEARPLEGFVYAITPFNFTSIAGNLPTAPALLGNTVIWKPSPHALFSNYVLMQLLEAAGLPPGVINFVPGDAEMVTAVVLSDEHFAGLHYTGSTAVFRKLWHAVGVRLDRFREYPRLVGETGGKDFLVAHSSADMQAVAAALIRGSFEYQGQKCSALSRAYIPSGMWPELKDLLIAEIATIRVGDISDFTNFMGAVIHRTAFDRVKGAIDRVRVGDQAKARVIAGGECDSSVGYFIKPTVVEAFEPGDAAMCDEFFGPLLTVHVYDDRQKFGEVLALCDRTSPYALTGAIFATDRRAIVEAEETLRYAAGNFYINDKPTGAVVGQQPFGGSRASGTNDKAGSALNLLRWITPRTIKETFDPPRDYRMGFTASK